MSMEGMPLDCKQCIHRFTSKHLQIQTDAIRRDVYSVSVGKRTSQPWVMRDCTEASYRHPAVASILKTICVTSLNVTRDVDQSFRQNTHAIRFLVM